MPTVVEPRRRGRPPTHPVDRLRTKIWFSAIRQSSGLPTAYAIEMALDGDRIRKRQTDVARPRKWDGYQKGSTVPVDKPGPRNAVDQAEIKFPGTACWFRSPLWSYLRGELREAHAIEAALRTLDMDVASVLFEEPLDKDLSEVRQRPFDENSVEQLLAIAKFDTLVAAVLLVGLSEAIASPELRESVLHLYLNLQTTIRMLPELQADYMELFSLIDQRCKHWIYLSSNRRMDVVVFWQGVESNSTNPPTSSE